jgi:hypothetical protein
MKYLKDSTQLQTRLARAQARADAFGLRTGAAITEHAQSLPHDFVERLRVSRLQAVAARKPAVFAPAGQTAGGVAAMGNGTAAMNGGMPGGFWSNFEDSAFFRFFGPFLPILALVLGFWLMGMQSSGERISEIASVDVAILQDEVPPAAYADPGFAQFMRDNR